MALFNISEIYQFAIAIEENGEKFYRAQLKKFNDENIKKLFSFLADEEIKHKETFKSMLEKIEKYEPKESYPGEYFLYLKSYAENVIFNEKELDSKIKKIKNLKSVLDFAIKLEWDSILYYQEMKIYVSADSAKLIDDIIKEERKHFIKLSEARKNLK
jgi:rubrerythrin